ncbi:MAG: YifB family Mg chelatase-like AAA ATPase [Phycisphaerae bacterium]|nr:YifB family Mg chelatase-like AAA ATPase [Phycisphaerae bacterium]
MLVRVQSQTLFGIEAVPCEVEVNTSSHGFATAIIVGMPDAAVKESLERIRTAMSNAGYAPPEHRTVINLAPADVRKEGPSLDLPIALGMCFAADGIAPELLSAFMVAGELALDGRTRPIKGALSMAMLARERGLRGVIVPRDNAAEAAVVREIEVIPVSNMTEAVGYLTEQLEIEPASLDLSSVFAEQSKYDVDFGDVRGQEFAKRAVTIAAAGHHNLLLIGPPGVGKTLMVKCLPTILPALSMNESLETTRIWSAAGKLPPGSPLIGTRPIRSPHHSASAAALVGGGSVPQAGEVSLAHHGVLFLDEFPEFQRGILETLRQPMEDGCVTIARSHSAVRFPAQFMLVAAMNPCPCGYHDDPKRPCKCTLPQIDKYRSRVSGPLLDRIDIHFKVRAVSYESLRDRKPDGGAIAARPGTTSAEIRERVVATREIQRRRFGRDNNIMNSRMSPKLVREHCPLTDDCEHILKAAMTELGLSARAHDKVLRVARTIADLDGSEQIRAPHLNEAVNYRQLDRQM